MIGRGASLTLYTKPDLRPEYFSYGGDPLGGHDWDSFAAQINWFMARMGHGSGVKQ